VSKSINVQIIAESGTEEENIEGAASLAWEHAVTASEQVGIELGSDDFVKLFERLNERYQYCGKHYGYIQHFSMRLLAALIGTGHVVVLSDPHPTEEDVVKTVNVLTQVIMSAMMWSHASSDTSWIPNEYWSELQEDTRGVTFVFESNCTCELEEGTDDNDR
jgi:hypothetical protein